MGRKCSDLSYLVFDNATLIDGTGADPIENGRLVISDGVIADVGARNDVAIPEGALVRDSSGLTLMPGLVDCHTHLGGTFSADYGDWVLEDDRRQAIVSTVQMGELMRHGVTTVRDISRNGIQLKWAVDKKIMQGPRIIACGPGLSRTGGHGDAYHLPIHMVQQSHPWGFVADGPEELRKAVRRAQPHGIRRCEGVGHGRWHVGEGARNRPALRPG